VLWGLLLLNVMTAGKLLWGVVVGDGTGWAMTAPGLVGCCSATPLSSGGCGGNGRAGRRTRAGRLPHPRVVDDALLTLSSRRPPRGRSKPITAG
jgi:hypothetical protein